MKKHWIITIVYVALAWLVYLGAEFAFRSVSEFLGFGAYIILLLAGLIALVIRLIRALVKRRGALAALAMALAVLPLVFAGEIRDFRVHLEDTLWRGARMEVIEELAQTDRSQYEWSDIELGRIRQHLAKDATVTVTRLTGGYAYTFWNYRGIPDGSMGTVYCPAGNPQDVPELNRFEMLFCESLGEDWYYVGWE
ncbi:MAG: hypothetical protein IJO98_10350 [Clostridia bacterium]|nr:hypothetical protein [Clostridia bacterium]